MSRTSFSKKDQKELALFLAANPHAPRNGNSIYKEFVKTHPNHSWQSWRAHYCANPLSMDATIRAMLRRLNQKRTMPTQNENTDHRSRSPPQARTSGPSDRKSKGKGKAQPVEAIEIDRDPEIPRDSMMHRTSHQPQEFDLRRISGPRPSEFPKPCSVNRSSSNEARPICPGPSAPVITMSPEEEQEFVRFISRQREGDLRLSLQLYEAYHLQAPKYTPHEYRAYYRVHGHKIRNVTPLRPISQEPIDAALGSVINPSNPIFNGGAINETSEVAEHIPGPKNYQVEEQLESGEHPLLETDALSVSTGSEDELELDVEEQIESGERPLLETDALSVSTGSEDELELDYILSSSNHSELISTLKISRELLQSFLELQGDIFGLPDPVRTTAAPASPIAEEPQSFAQTSNDRTPSVESQNKPDKTPEPNTLEMEQANGNGPSTESSCNADTGNLPVAENPCSAKTRRTPVIQERELASRNGRSTESSSNADARSSPAAENPCSANTPRTPIILEKEVTSGNGPIIELSSNADARISPAAKNPYPARASRTPIIFELTSGNGPSTQSSSHADARISPAAESPCSTETLRKPIVLEQELAGGNGPSTESSSNADARSSPAAEVPCSAKTPPIILEKEVTSGNGPNTEPSSNAGARSSPVAENSCSPRTLCPPIIIEKEVTGEIGPSTETNSNADARNSPTAENSCSAKTSRTTSSFKPAQPPSTMEEAVALMGVFLNDFGDLYSPSEAVNLFHQCGDWTLMFEVATLKKLEKRPKKTQDGRNVNGISNQDDEEEVDQDYILEVKSRMWTPEEDALISKIASIGTENLPDRKARLAQLLRDSLSDGASKLGQLIATRGVQAIKNRMAFLIPIHQSDVE